MPVFLQGAGAAADLPGGYGAALLQALLALAAVCLLAWVVLRWLARRGFGGASTGGGRIEVIERISLDARRSLYLVRVGERVWLLGAGEGAAPTALAELAPEDVPPLEEEARGRSFSEVIERLTKGGSAR